MSRWKQVAKTSDCPPGSSLEVVVDDQMIALYNVGGKFYALDGVCPHQGGPLGKGQLQGCIVTCPWHGWQFDVSNGQSQLNPSLCQPHFPVAAQNDTILVDLERNE